MATTHIDTKNVTKPIQLLGAWLIGLILVNAAFLAAAANMSSTERLILVCAAVGNVPVFLIALFLLQTKFRPELQEDAFYSRYLDTKTNQVVTHSRFDNIDSEIAKLKVSISEQILSATQSAQGSRETITSLEVRGQHTLPTLSSPSLIGEIHEVALNSHLQDFQKIRSILKEKKIKVSDIFSAEDPPDGRYLAIAEGLSFDAQIDVLKLAFELQLESYWYFDASKAKYPEEVLIGAYGRPQIPLTTELLEIINSQPEPGDLRFYESRFPKERKRRPIIVEEAVRTSP